MTDLPNSHEALLRNRDLLTGRLVLLGVSSPALIARLPAGGIAVSERWGDYQQLDGNPHWQPVFGYAADALAAGIADTVVIFMPKAKAELALRLGLARWLLAPGGKVVVVGEKIEGIAGAVTLLKNIADDPVKVDSARHCQVWLGHPQPATTFDLADWHQWHPVERAGVGFRVCGLPGIFSDGRLDDGTALLLDSLARSPVRGPVLDFACGAGVIGTWLQLWQRQRGETPAPVDGVDVQAQAVWCARETYREAGVEGDIRASDGLAGVTGHYRTILSNPPFHTGVRTDTGITARFLQDAARHLLPGGELRLVANTFLPYEEPMKRFVGPVAVLHRDKRFTIYSAKRH